MRKVDQFTIVLHMDTRKLRRDFAAIATSFASSIDAVLDRAERRARKPGFAIDIAPETKAPTKLRRRT